MQQAKTGARVRTRMRLCTLAVVAGASLGLLAGTATAAEWTRGASLSVGGIYTDNARLTPDHERSDFITVVRPSASLVGRGARASVVLSGALEFNDLGGDSDNVNPFLNALGNVELVEDFLFIDAYARAYQTTVDPFRAYGDTPLNRAENSETAYMWGISPYLRKRFGSFANFEARYRTDDQISADNRFDDSTQQHLSASLTSGSDFGRIDWGLHAQQRRTEYSNNAGTGRGQDNEFSDADLRLGYRLNRQWRLTSSVGHEKHEYDAASRDRNRTTWSAGFVWTPNPRTSLAVSQEHRSFNNKPRVDFSWRKRHLNFHASYEYTLNDTRSLRARAGDLFGSDPLAPPQYDPVTGEPLPLSRDLTFLNAGMVADERFQSSLTLTGLRSTLTLNGRHSKQTREDSGEQAIFDDFSVRATRKLSRTLSLNGGVLWGRDEDNGGAQADTLRYSVGLSRQLGVHSSVALNYSHSERDSDRPLDDYTENRVYVNFMFTL